MLTEVSFTAEPGQTIALVGPTGAGKTTIINLICRFYDIQRGEILIDGVDIRRLDRRALRKQLGIVLQEPFLFSDTIEENIRYGNLAGTDEQKQSEAGPEGPSGLESGSETVWCVLPAA